MRIDSLNLESHIIYISPLNNGQNLGNNEISWGDEKGKEDPNYDLVYIYHELLHTLFADCAQKDEKVSHSLIQFFTDWELCGFLNNNQKKYEIHSYLQTIMTSIYPFMQIYFNKTKEIIQKEMDTDNRFFELNNYEQYRNILSKLNCFEMFEWFNNNKKIWYTNPKNKRG